MSTLQTLIEDRIRAAKGEEQSARIKGDFDAQDWHGDLASELQSLLDRSPLHNAIELDKNDAEALADFLADNEESFVEFLYKRRVSLPRRHSDNLKNALRGGVG